MATPEKQKPPVYSGSAKPGTGKIAPSTYDKADKEARRRKKPAPKIDA